MDIREVLGLNEHVLEFEITSNRADCFSVIGLSREVAATYKRPFRLKKPEVQATGADVAGEMQVRIEAEELCPRYTARMVRGVRIAESPAWLKRRLELSGVRPINNIVDITNYVMLEYGQPMHAFDVRTLEGRSICVRRALDGERMKTLDGNERVLDSSMLVIADAKKPVAVAGVMGGENSEIEPDTTTILFESATFNGASVRTTAKKLGLRTEASSRYEKGLDPNMTLDAVNRACELVQLLDAGEVAKGVLDVHGALPGRRAIPFRPEKINAFLGTEIPAGFMEETLKNLDFELGDDFVYPPTYRTDVEAEPDVAEEVARIYGYNNIPSTLMHGEALPGGKNDKQKSEDLIRSTLTAQGLYEIMTYSFISPKLYSKLGLEMDDPIAIANPLGEDQSIMRTMTIGSMLEVVATNCNYRNDEAYLFEIATKYKKNDTELADEEQEIDIAMYGKDVDYYVLKGVVEQLLRTFGITYYEIEPERENPVFHPGQAANIYLKRKKAAVIGRIHPTVQKNFGINVPVFAAVIDFNLLMECKKMERSYKRLPKYPAVTRDLAVIVEEGLPVREIENVFRSAKTNLIERYALFDVYRGEQIGEGLKSVAYSLTFRHPDRTLTDDDVNPVVDDIVKTLESKFGARLRDN